MDSMQRTTRRNSQNSGASGSSPQIGSNNNGQPGVPTDKQQEQIDPVQPHIGRDGQGSIIQTGGTHVTVDSVKTVAEDQQPSVLLDTAHPNAQQQKQSANSQNAVLTSATIEADPQNAVLTSATIEADPQNAVLTSATIEEIEKPDKQQEPDNSPAPQPQDPNKGHYETKPSGIMMWGFVLCCCVLSAPLGGGFAFLLTPAQFASFGLVVFWKEGKRKVWKLDKKSLPGDSLVTTQEDLEKLITNAENGTLDNILTRVPDGQVDALSAEMVKDLPQEKQQQGMEDLSTFAANMQAIAIDQGMSPEEAQQMTSFISSPERNPAMLQSLVNSDIKGAMESFISAADEQAKRDAAKQLVESLKEAMHEIASATGEFPYKKLLDQLNNSNLTKKLIEDLAARQDQVKKSISPLLNLGTPDRVLPKSHVIMHDGRRNNSNTSTPDLS